VRRRKAGRPRAALRGDGETQRLMMLGAVYDLISREGIEGGSMREIAAAARVSTGTLNHHFKNKKSLLIEALRAAYHLPNDWDHYVGSPEAQLRRIMLSYAMPSESHRWWRFWVNYLALSTRDRAMQQEQSVRYERQLRFWTRLVEDGMGAGEFKAGLDAEATARDLLVRAHGLVALQLMKPDAAMRRYAREQVDVMIDALHSI
jgi:AcrR family transcriptional regulator